MEKCRAPAEHDYHWFFIDSFAHLLQPPPPPPPTHPPLEAIFSQPRPTEIRVLVLGSGPVAATRRFTCAYGAVGETVSCDAFARLYRQLAFETGFTPPEGFPEKLGLPITPPANFRKCPLHHHQSRLCILQIAAEHLRYCDVEELWQVYPKDYFHIVYVSNALDHTVHPVRGLRMLLWVLREDGQLLLRHLRTQMGKSSEPLALSCPARSEECASRKMVFAFRWPTSVGLRRHTRHGRILAQWRIWCIGPRGLALEK